MFQQKYLGFFKFKVREYPFRTKAVLRQYYQFLRSKYIPAQTTSRQLSDNFKDIYTLLESFTKQFITVAKILRGDTYARFSNERLRYYALAICSLAVSNIFSNSSIFSTAPGLGVNVFN